MKVLSFVVPISDNCQAVFKYRHNEAGTGKENWKISWGTGFVRLQLTFAESMQLLTMTKGIWTSAVKTLLADYSRFGVHLPPGDEKLVAQFYLNWHALPEEPDQWPLCGPGRHSTSEGSIQCTRCGTLSLQAESSSGAEEEAAAELCDCGETEENCTCPACDFCNQKESECICVLCDECNMCKCENNKHFRKHPTARCTCDTPCTKKTRREKHGFLKCICESLLCEDCQERADACICDSESSSGDFEY